MLVAISVVAVLTAGEITEAANGEAGVLLDVVREGAPDFPIDTIFPFLTVFAVANTALINMLMASRLVYGMANQGVLPRGLGKVLPGRGRRGPHRLHHRSRARPDHRRRPTCREHRRPPLPGTTALLLLGVFTIVNVACLVLRRDPPPEGAFRAPRSLPVRRRRRLPLPRRPVGPARPTWCSTRSPAACWCRGRAVGLTWLTNRGVRAKKTGFRDIEHLEDRRSSPSRAHTAEFAPAGPGPPSTVGRVTRRPLGASPAVLARVRARLHVRRSAVPLGQRDPDGRPLCDDRRRPRRPRRPRTVDPRARLPRAAGRVTARPCLRLPRLPDAYRFVSAPDFLNQDVADLDGGRTPRSTSTPAPARSPTRPTRSTTPGWRT